MVERSPSITPEFLWQKLEEFKGEFITIPHHTTVVDHPFNWDMFDSRYDRLVEVFSGWGNSEKGEQPLRDHGSDKYEYLSARKALQEGCIFGFVSGSDSHDGCPGKAQGTAGYNTANKFSEVGSGYTAVFADSLKRRSIFEGLWNRSCYAVTGAK